MKGYTFLLKGTIMKVINKIKEKFNDTKEWIVDHKAGLVTDDELYPEVVDEIHKMMNED